MSTPLDIRPAYRVLAAPLPSASPPTRPSDEQAAAGDRPEGGGAVEGIVAAAGVPVSELEGMVEMRGLEPLTPAMRTRCSPS